MTKQEAYIALNMIEGLDPVRVRSLIETLGAAEAIFDATPDELMKAHGVGIELSRTITERRAEIDPLDEIKKAKKWGARIITLFDDEYPELLKTIYDPPLALYVKGTLEKEDRRSIAIVGSRRSTHYGQQGR
ncbi:MAG: hypothetical protein GKR87_08650 [Kiritimatiellae bacterium]|nr:hypothetical protein [Kiritimatiellia bacterium]